MLRRPPQSTRTYTLFPLHDALPIYRCGVEIADHHQRRALGAVIAVVKVADARGGGGADHLFGADGDAVCDRHPPHLEVELVDEAAQLVSVARAPFGKDDAAFAVDRGGIDRQLARGLADRKSTRLNSSH